MKKLSVDDSMQNDRSSCEKIKTQKLIFIDPAKTAKRNGLRAWLNTVNATVKSTTTVQILNRGLHA